MCPTLPVLAYANLNNPFRLHTDASDFSLGAILYHIHKDGMYAMILYAS